MMYRKLRTLSFVLVVVFLGVSFANAAEQRERSSRKMQTAPLKTGTLAATTIECPAKLEGVDINIESQISPPSGWTAKGAPTGYSTMTLVRAYHSVLSDRLWCTYARSSLQTSLRITSIFMPAPANRTCTAVEDFKFSCK
jgi:hypothetical protein